MTLSPWSILVIFIVAPASIATLVTLVVLALTKPRSDIEGGVQEPPPARDSVTDLEDHPEAE